MPAGGSAEGFVDVVAHAVKGQAKAGEEFLISGGDGLAIFFDAVDFVLDKYRAFAEFPGGVDGVQGYALPGVELGELLFDIVGAESFDVGAGCAHYEQVHQRRAGNLNIRVEEGVAFVVDVADPKLGGSFAFHGIARYYKWC